ncbi:MAG: NTP transferase domain-containing protein [Desulfovibrio sp.]|nr:NTP transferase domain-containing protein [Desulfovibrio sp.]
MLAALILAAGQAKRMGQVKACLPLADHSALGIIVKTYRDLGLNHILVISGYHAEVVEEKASELGVNYLRNKEPSLGMFSSVQAGLARLAQRADLEAAFIHPVDCPLIRPLTLKALKQRERTSVLLPSYQGQIGHPTLLPSQFFPAILKQPRDLDGGLKTALANLPKTTVPVADSYILLDMDTPEQYARLVKLSRQRSSLSLAEAETLLNLLKLPAKALRHARAVGLVACALAHALKLDHDLALVGGYLHDLAKGQPCHEQAGAKFLEDLGLPLLAWLIRDHRDLSLAEGAQVSEREVVYLADKYCFGSQFVTINERFGQKLELFAHDQAAQTAIKGRLSRALALEARLSRELGCAPASLAFDALKNI